MRRRTRLRILFSLLAIVSGVAVAVVLREPVYPPPGPGKLVWPRPKQPPPRWGTPIEPATAEAWTKAGFTIQGNHDHDAQPIVASNSKKLPDVSGLPEIRVPFWLVVGGRVEAAWLKGLPGLKNLVRLCVRNGGLTDDVFGVLADEGLLHTLVETRFVPREAPKPAADTHDSCYAGLFNFRVLVGGYPAPLPSSEYGFFPGRPGGSDDVAFLDLRSTQVTGECLKHLTAFRNLRGIDLTGTQIDGESLRHLTNLKQRLTSLDLGSTPVSDAGLRHLATLPNLTTLWLDLTPATDAGLEHVAKLQSLTTLSVGPGITGAGLEHLSRLPNLTTLHVWGGLKDADLRPLGNFKRLTTLSLLGGDITDAGLQHLAGLTTLKVLCLNHLKLDGSGFAHLSKLRELNYLTVIRSAKPLGEGLRHLVGFPNLATLDLRGNGEMTPVLKHLKGCISLANLHLDLVNPPAYDDTLIEGLASAGLLHLHKGARDEHGKRPTSQDKVVKLYLQGLPSERSVEHLKQLTSLKLIELVGVNRYFGSQAQAELKKAIPGLEIETEP